MDDPVGEVGAIVRKAAGGRNAPDLTHVASRDRIAAGSFPNDRAHLTHWIVHSQSLKPGNNMPVLAMDGSELEALVRYVETLR
jgi:cytochrome c oxidase subunit 2